MNKVRPETIEPTLDTTDLQKRVIKIIKNEHSTARNELVQVNDIKVIEKIMEVYGDSINRKILNFCVDIPHTVSEISKILGISPTTGYRKIISLVKNQFLVPYDYLQRDGVKKISRYLAAIKKLQIEIVDNQDIKMSVIFLNKSFL